MSFASVFAYENLAFSGSSITLTVIIWGVYIGLVVGCIASAYSRDYLGRIVRALVSAQCRDEKSAASAEALGIRCSAPLRRAMRDGGVLRKYISIANPEECISDTAPRGFFAAVRRFFSGSESIHRLDLKAAKLYIPEEKRYTAELRYEKKGPSWVIVVLIIVLGAATAVGVSFAVPKILDLLDQAITAFKSIGKA